ncbi:uncharacterized protein LOC120110527 [Phoenix dactylifera]|uniref:Uncharacterized protein LOC120110527 n=1 Tax=Phoenix dactylifera TaxID=42345 RepID=A0A8B9A4Y1_PHODC|nr:uncharacterized protein LOC120110527 [Phoenix dactylifera]
MGLPRERIGTCLTLLGPCSLSPPSLPNSGQKHFLLPSMLLIGCPLQSWAWTLLICGSLARIHNTRIFTSSAPPSGRFKSGLVYTRRSTAPTIVAAPPAVSSPPVELNVVSSDPAATVVPVLDVINSESSTHFFLRRLLQHSYLLMSGALLGLLGFQTYIASHITVSLQLWPTLQSLLVILKLRTNSVGDLLCRRNLMLS